MSETVKHGNFEATPELGSDNFHTSIYESDYNGLLIARCNQNGNYPHQVTAILNGLNGKQVSSELIAQQADEIARLRRELAEAQEFRAILEGHLGAAIDDYNEARAAAFIEAAEIAEAFAKQLRQAQLPHNEAECLCEKFRAKAGEGR